MTLTGIEKDLEIRRFIQDTAGRAGISRVEIERFPHQVSISIRAAKPGMYLFNKVGQDLDHKPVILNRSAAEVKNLALDRRFGHCNVRFFASLRFAQNDTPKY